MNFIDERISKYVDQKSNIPSKLTAELGDYTKENHPLGRMVCGELVASILGFMIRSHKMQRVLEIGTFTGYSALAMAENLPADGELITIDKNKKINKFASSYWKKSPHGNKIKALFGEAMKVIPSLSGHFDLVFIDADKRNYINYLNLCLPLLSPQGIIIVDNVLWSGRVVDGFSSEEPDKSTPFLKEFNDYVEQSNDLYGTLLPVRDGLFMIQKI